MRDTVVSMVFGVVEISAFNQERTLQPHKECNLMFQYYVHTTDHRSAMLRSMEVFGITDFKTRYEDGVMIMMLEYTSAIPDLVWYCHGLMWTYTANKDESKRRKEIWKQTVKDWRSARERVPALAA